MCIAVYKPMGVDFPCKRVLKRCFYKNPDGAGFMVANGNTVEIHKGYMGFRSFWKALRTIRAEYGDDKAYVMHFRISTQGGVRRDGCHPFPLSKNMDDMRKLDTAADIGIAHNGIIDLCSDYSFYSGYYSGYRGGYSGYYNSKKSVDYSDTMKFITEYLSLIIKDRSYYTDPDTIQLINKLCDSRLAILDASGHCEIIGSGWEQSEGVWYSNNGYKESEIVTTTCHSYPTTTTKSDTNDKFSWDGYYDDDDYTYDADGFPVSYKVPYSYDNPYDPYADYLADDGFYDFSQSDCPATLDGDDSYCIECRQWCECWRYGENDNEEQPVYEIVKKVVKEAC